MFLRVTALVVLLGLGAFLFLGLRNVPAPTQAIEKDVSTDISKDISHEHAQP